MCQAMEEDELRSQVVSDPTDLPKVHKKCHQIRPHTSPHVSPDTTVPSTSTQQDASMRNNEDPTKENEPCVSDWVSGGPVGAKGAVLVFRSCVLASRTPSMESATRTVGNNTGTNILLKKAQKMARRLVSEPHSFSVRPKNIMHDVMETFGNGTHLTGQAYVVRHVSESDLPQTETIEEQGHEATEEHKRGIEDVLNDLSKITLKKHLNIENTTANINVEPPKPPPEVSDTDTRRKNKKNKGKSKRNCKNGPQAPLLQLSPSLDSDDSEHLLIKEVDSIKVLESQHMPAAMLKMTYKLVNTETKLLHRLLQAHGLQEAPSDSKDFNLLWAGLHPKPDVLRSLSPYQRVNHFPSNYGPEKSNVYMTDKITSPPNSYLLKCLLDAHGLKQVEEDDDDWTLYWGTGNVPLEVLQKLSPDQRVNHFPRSYELTRKDKLFKNIEKMQYFRGLKHFDFIPTTFLMPAEYKELCTTHYRTKGPWIVKPAASSRGRGIYIVNTPEQIPKGENVVVAKYIDKPLLIGGHKCDLRLYVCVTSIDPLLIYLYEEGLVRFATVKYDKTNKNLWNPCMHLCNYSINKYHTDYIKCDDPNAGNVGHKWTLSALLRYLRKQGRNTTALMAAVEDLVVKSVLSSAQTITAATRVFVPNFNNCFGHKWALSALLRYLRKQGRNTTALMAAVEDLVVKSVLSSAQTITAATRVFVPNFNNCFELFGFDILVDDMLKPWLLEINLSPSLACESPLDARVKSALLADTLTLVGLPATPMAKGDAAQNNSLKMRIGACRRVHSAENMFVSGRSKANPPAPAPAPLSLGTAGTGALSALTGEEVRLVRAVRAQYARRGGYVRIFPSQNSWQKYSQYLDPVTGIPVCSTSLNNNLSYSVVQHNYNLLIHSHVLPHFQHAVAATSLTDTPERLKRYEAVTITATAPAICLGPAAPRRPHGKLAKDAVKGQLSGTAKLTMGECRRAFGLFLTHVLKRVSNPSNELAVQHANLVIKFLKRASNTLRMPYNVKGPTGKMCDKDKCAVIAKQLNDFLYMYYRETDLYTDSEDRDGCISNIQFAQFLYSASEADLEDVLLLLLAKENYVVTFLGDQRAPYCIDLPPSKLNDGTRHQLLRYLANLAPINTRRFRPSDTSSRESEEPSPEPAATSSDVVLKDSLKEEKPLSQALKYARS